MAMSHISGYTFAHHTGEGLRAFMRRTAPNRRFLALFDPSPVVADIDDETFGEMVEYRPVWSCNEREAVVIAGGLGWARDRGTVRTPIERVARRMNSALIVRVGKGGAWLARPGAEAELVAGFPVHAIDTNGAGDCHAGVLCAELSRGTGLREAVGIANAAAAIAVTRRGPATCPSRIEVEKAACHANLIVIMTISWVMMCRTVRRSGQRTLCRRHGHFLGKCKGSEGDITENEQG